MKTWARGVLFLFTLVSSGVAWSLSLWQVHRLTARKAANRNAEAARNLPVFDRDTSPTHLPESFQRIRVTGRWDPTWSVVLRGRVEQDTPGVLLVTALRLADQGQLLLVNRGFVPAPDAFTLDSTILTPLDTGWVTIDGFAFALPDDADGGNPIEGPRSHLTYRRLNASSLVRTGLPEPITPYYVLLGEDTAHHGWPRVISPPRLDNGPHLSYALQWFGIGAAILAFGIVFILRDVPTPTVGPPKGNEPHEAG